MIKCMNAASFRIGLLSLAALAIAGIAQGAAPSTAKKGETFIIGTDAPLASVASFNVQIESIDAVDTVSNTSTPLLSGPITVDFARFNGLQTLLDINQVPAGTYNEVVVTLGTAQIGYLATASGAAPTIQTMNATLTTNTLTRTFKSPITVSETIPVGIRLDFDLHKSIQVTNGQISGNVDPVIQIGIVGPDAPEAFIDEFDTAVLSTDAGDLNTNTIAQISGTLDRATATITADDISILSQSGFYAGGLATYVTPSSGKASSFDLYVRGLLPASGTGVQLGQIATVDLAGTEKFSIRWDRNPLIQFLFNSSSILPGQSIAVGGPASGAAKAGAVTVKRVNLRDWGYVGHVVKGSVKVGKGTFQVQVDGFAGQLIPQTVTVYVTDRCEFRYGYTGLHELEGGDLVRVVGLLLKNPVNGSTVLVGRYVDYLN